MLYPLSYGRSVVRKRLVYRDLQSIHLYRVAIVREPVLGVLCDQIATCGFVAFLYALRQPACLHVQVRRRLGECSVARQLLRVTERDPAAVVAAGNSG